MNLRTILTIVFLSTVFSPLRGQESVVDPSEVSTLFGTENPTRVIMVGFTDRHIDRVEKAMPAYSYRRRGPYKGSTYSKRVGKEIAQDYSLQQLSEWPMSELGIHCIVFRVPESMSVEKVLEKLSRDTRLDVVQKMHNYQTMASTQYTDPYFKLQSTIQSMQISDVHNKTTGRNVTVALIDTGVDLNHQDLQGQIVEYKNFATEVSSGFSDDKHGTAIAGIIAARANNGLGIVGVAPDAQLVVLKACWPIKSASMEAVCNSFTLALALNTAVKLDVDILNMSLTGPYDPLLAKLLDIAIKKGIVVVAADPGTDHPGHRFPASMESVIAVQSQQTHPEKNGDSHLLAGPGIAILTTQPHDTYDFVSGDSLATAHVSGVIALFLELSPELSNKQIENLLEITTPVISKDINAPGMDTLSAIEKLGNISRIQ